LSEHGWKPKDFPEIFKFSETYLNVGLLKGKEEEKFEDVISVEKENDVKEEMKNVFSFPLFTTDFCQKLVKEIENFLIETSDTGVALRVSTFGFDKVVEETV